jgi:hypothetical protein
MPCPRSKLQRLLTLQLQQQFFSNGSVSVVGGGVVSAGMISDSVIGVGVVGGCDGSSGVRGSNATSKPVKKMSP